MKLIGKYLNGNYEVKMYDDGTKVRITQEDEFVSSFPECIDLKITNCCDMGCKYCHENSTVEGKHGDIINSKFIDSLHPYTELALGGGNVLTHPNLEEFLIKLHSKRIIANITVNQHHFMKEKERIEYLYNKKLIKGLGVSLNSVDNEFINEIKKYPNVVIHVINGVVNIQDLKKLYGHNLKMLILGYKQFRKGLDFYSDKVEQNKKIIYDNIQELIDNFKVVSFDNLAIEQIDVKRLMTNEEWEEFYMGDDGKFTMYIDLPNNKYASSSISKIRYDIIDNIEDMFKIVKLENN